MAGRGKGKGGNKGNKASNTRKQKQKRGSQGTGVQHEPPSKRAKKNSHANQVSRAKEIARAKQAERVMKAREQLKSKNNKSKTPGKTPGRQISQKKRILEMKRQLNVYCKVQKPPIVHTLSYDNSKSTDTQHIYKLVVGKATFRGAGPTKKLAQLRVYSMAYQKLKLNKRKSQPKSPIEPLHKKHTNPIEPHHKKQSPLQIEKKKDGEAAKINKTTKTANMARVCQKKVPSHKPISKNTPSNKNEKKLPCVKMSKIKTVKEIVAPKPITSLQPSVTVQTQFNQSPSNENAKKMSEPKLSSKIFSSDNSKKNIYNPNPTADISPNISSPDSMSLVEESDTLEKKKTNVNITTESDTFNKMKNIDQLDVNIATESDTFNKMKNSDQLDVNIATESDTFNKMKNIDQLDKVSIQLKNVKSTGKNVTSQEKLKNVKSTGINVTSQENVKSTGKNVTSQEKHSSVTVNNKLLAEKMITNSHLDDTKKNVFEKMITNSHLDDTKKNVFETQNNPRITKIAPMSDTKSSLDTKNDRISVNLSINLQKDENASDNDIVKISKLKGKKRKNASDNDIVKISKLKGKKRKSLSKRETLSAPILAWGASFGTSTSISSVTSSSTTQLSNSVGVDPLNCWYLSGGPPLFGSRQSRNLHVPKVKGNSSRVSIPPEDSTTEESDTVNDITCNPLSSSNSIQNYTLGFAPEKSPMSSTKQKFSELLRQLEKERKETMIFSKKLLNNLLGGGVCSSTDSEL